MPFQIANATIVIPAAASVDVHQDGIEVTGIDEPIDFEHGQNKEYSVVLRQYKSDVTLHGLRQMGLNADGEDMIMALFDLTLTFKRGGKMVDFCIRLKECGYTEPTHDSSSGAQECIGSSLPHSQFPPRRAKQGFNSLKCHE
ncbi:hypothetical protein WR25_12884 [Diploscapter pachys]|uniref:Uncharacterized protein n=1 Tax=Diploscapter pachys TaxID=2018661 RepID=A0A2A2LV23_9BILA|nr:hypothetical protein WR25_12884 [Diploscapter pachys]